MTPENKPVAKRKVESYDISKSDETLFLAVDLAKFIKEQKLYHQIQGKDYVNVEGWQYAGSRLGILPIIKEITNISNEQEIKYQAKVELLNLRTEQIVGAGFAICSNKEQGKKYYQEFAIASMAQTRAIGKAYRNILAWIIRAAGYEPTPAEEMDYMADPVEKKPEPKPFTPAQNFSPSDRVHVPKEKGAETMTKDVERHHQEAINSGDPTRPATTKQKAEILLMLNNEHITTSEKEKMVTAINTLDVERAEKAITKLKITIEQREAKHQQVTRPATVKQIERLNYLMNDDVVTERERAEYVKASAVLTSEQAFSLIEFWEKTIPARRAVEAEERSPV